jgi:hypothetical protein
MIMKTNIKLLSSSAIIITILGLPNASWSREREAQDIDVPTIRQNREITNNNGNVIDSVAVNAERSRVALQRYEQGQNDISNQITNVLLHGKPGDIITMDISAGHYRTSASLNRYVDRTSMGSSNSYRYGRSFHDDTTRHNQGSSNRGGGASFLGISLGGGHTGSHNNRQTNIHSGSQSSVSNNTSQTHRNVDEAKGTLELDFQSPAVVGFSLQRGGINQNKILPQPQPSKYVASTSSVSGNMRHQSNTSNNQHTQTSYKHAVNSNSSEKSQVKFPGTGNKLGGTTTTQTVDIEGFTEAEINEQIQLLAIYERNTKK